MLCLEPLDIYKVPLSFIQEHSYLKTDDLLKHYEIKMSLMSNFRNKVHRCKKSTGTHLRYLQHLQYVSRPPPPPSSPAGSGSLSTKTLCQNRP
jgi:hypothetical protein